MKKLLRPSIKSCRKKVSCGSRPTHIDRHHIHNHIIWNSTSLDHTRKFRYFWGSTRAVRRLSDTICVENGYSIVEQPKDRGKS